jgi:hypothetical protein
VVNSIILLMIIVMPAERKQGVISGDAAVGRESEAHPAFNIIPSHERFLARSQTQLGNGKNLKVANCYQCAHQEALEVFHYPEHPCNFFRFGDNCGVWQLIKILRESVRPILKRYLSSRKLCYPPCHKQFAFKSGDLPGVSSGREVPKTIS